MSGQGALARRCACVKAEVKYSLACYGIQNTHGGPIYPNVFFPPLQEAKKRLKVQDREEEKVQKGHEEGTR